MTYASQDDIEFELPNPDGAPKNVAPPLDPEPAPEVAEDEQPEFTDEEVSTFSSLLTVGMSLRKHTVLGHEVLLGTPTVDDEMRVGLFTKEFRETEGYIRAFQTGIVAASIREVDGKPFVKPNMVPDTPDELFHRKLEQVRKMYPLAVSLLYQRVIQDEQRYAELAAKLGKL